MKIFEYIKRREEEVRFEALCEDESFLDCAHDSRMKRLMFLLVPLLLVPLFFVFQAFWGSNVIKVSSEDSVKLVSSPVAATSVKKGTITIPSGTVKANPFLPYKEMSTKKADDAPSYTLVEPPTMLQEASDATRVMDTIVSGILYDKFSPSAILNIEGNDYLVKKGDVVNNYKIVNIMQDSVTVKLGANVYKAGIGEILTEGTLNYNDVSNLNNKFGGER